MTFDLRRALRRIKPSKFTGSLRRRTKSELPFVGAVPLPGRELLLDACVYIDVLQGSTPDTVDTLLRLRTVNHLSVCVAELTHLFGQLDPAHPGTRAALREVEGAIADIPWHRLHAPQAGVVAEAGILAGLLFRLGGGQPGQEIAALNDATVLLLALLNGQAVLTRNVRDFDLMTQILPEATVSFYERAA